MKLLSFVQEEEAVPLGPGAHPHALLRDVGAAGDDDGAQAGQAQQMHQPLVAHVGTPRHAQLLQICAIPRQFL